MIHMGFVLSRSRRSPSMEDILIALHQFGLPATPDQQRDPSSCAFEYSDGSSLVTSFVDAPHPDINAINFTSKSLGTELDATLSHLAIVLYQAEGDVVGSPDDVLMRSIAAVADATDAVAARIGFGLNYMMIDDFEASAKALGDGHVVPSRLSVGCDIAFPNDQQVSILSSGLAAYGLEEILILAPQNKKKVAVNLLWDFADNVRASADRLDVLTAATQSVEGLSEPPKRVPNPIAEDEVVVEIVLAD